MHVSVGIEGGDFVDCPFASSVSGDAQRRGHEQAKRSERIYASRPQQHPSVDAPPTTRNSASTVKNRDAGVAVLLRLRCQGASRAATSVS